MLSDNKPPNFYRWSKTSLMSMKERKKSWNYGIYFYYRKGEFVFLLSAKGNFVIWWNFYLNYYCKWPIKRTRPLFKNKSFWVGVFSDWALNQTWALIKKIKNNKKCQASKVSIKMTKFFPKLISKTILFLLFKLAPSFKWSLIRTRALIRNFLPKTGCLFGLDAQLSSGRLKALHFLRAAICRTKFIGIVNYYFVPLASFYTPQKKSENLWHCDFLGGVERNQCHKMG